MIGDRRLRRCIGDLWGLTGATVEVHNGGMNSATWFVGVGDRRWVAKAVVSGSRRSFAGGLAVASVLEDSGIPAGAPVVTRHGDMVGDVDGVPVALLRWVPGEGLSGARPGDQRLIGVTLARVHRALLDVSVPDAERFHWVDPRGEHLGIRPWIRGAVAGAVAAYDELDPRTLSWGLLHTDPAPEAFRLDRARGACGLIDWSTALCGPLLYDLASAVMYVGGPGHAGSLIEAYLDQGVVSGGEVERGLPVMLRFRWAVQADYFARRIATDDLTGIDSAAGNEDGLADAYAWFSGPRGRGGGRAGSDGRRAESDRGQAQSDRGQAQSDRGQAQSDRGQAQSDRGQAQSDRGQAQSDRGQAQSDRGQAQSDRGQAGPDGSGRIGDGP
ncbi:phosphotransferase [Amorphoplanes digitatis]|uniref:phosphotransferase enzyme family protein n=1 Tax=Actinoplanes digitatis TaxID=1868 RepID=UPI0035E8567D